MKKRLTKAVVLTSLLLTVALGAIGCKKVECDFCGETKRCSTTEIFGEEVNICKDCEKDLEDFASMFQ